MIDCPFQCVSKREREKRGQRVKVKHRHTHFWFCFMIREEKKREKRNKSIFFLHWIDDHHWVKSMKEHKNLNWENNVLKRFPPICLHRSILFPIRWKCQVDQIQQIWFRLIWTNESFSKIFIQQEDQMKKRQLKKDLIFVFVC